MEFALNVLLIATAFTILAIGWLLLVMSCEIARHWKKRRKPVELDTPTAKADGILPSSRPLKLDTLRCLAQRWDSPEATLGVPRPSWISPDSFFD